MQKKNSIKVLAWMIAILMMIFSSIVMINSDAGNPKIVMDFSFEKPVIEKVMINGEIYDRITMLDLPNYGNLGEPSLSVKPLRILLPQGTRVKEIEIIGIDKIILGKEYVIFPSIRLDKVQTGV